MLNNKQGVLNDLFEIEQDMEIVLSYILSKEEESSEMLRFFKNLQKKCSHLRQRIVEDGQR